MLWLLELALVGVEKGSASEKVVMAADDEDVIEMGMPILIPASELPNTPPLPPPTTLAIPKWPAPCSKPVYGRLPLFNRTMLVVAARARVV